MVDVGAYLVNRLTGTWRTTTAYADPLGLIDMERRDWADGLLERVGLIRERVPALAAPGDVIGELSPGAAEQLGLRPGCRWSAAPATVSPPALGANARARAGRT